ncbi:hypothetical protein EC9_19680 [Rosistilla ulvae]|uniref:Uncharacterized protein n=1 Tax=Rosistilla ulvae TaxID=1930277 RepID=A0A517LYT0_9BACT|nr:hypothetical protein [Rosistilla ulvae]QDS87786.1 hypothetical protein EC9_19680 [Rosistilla ulvae]
MNLRTFIERSLAAATLLGCASFPHSARAAGVLKLQIKDRQSNQPVAARVVMIGPRGREVPVRRATNAGIGWAIDGQIDLEVPSGDFQFHLTRGPEYRIMTGNFQIDRTAEDSHTITLERFVDTQAEGWLCGDLFVDHKLRDLPLLMRAEDLDIVSLANRTGDGKPTQTEADASAAEIGIETMQITTDNMIDRREGSGLLVVGADSTIQPVDDDAPSSLLFRNARKAPQARFVVENPFAWDLPIWLASGKVNGFALMGDFLQLDRSVSRVSNGRPATQPEYDNPLGLGFWADDIYHHILEAGFRIPPVAGSGSGYRSIKNPLGYNRVYVQCGEETSPEAFWSGLWSGRSVVTNGPLLRPRLDSQYPGHVFTSYGNEPLELQMDLQLGTRDPVDYLEVIYNGAVIYSARLEEFKDSKGVIPAFTFDRSGWVVARVVTGYDKHYRAAVSAPWYIMFPDQPRISRSAVEFFIDWLQQREQMLLKKSPEYIRSVTPFIRAARSFWDERLEQATVD